ncbi:MAG: hypothetical protein GX913_08650 [Clostridiales bacterium]|nr:hypothetical protein [Clostridiales bacterium]
MALEFESLINQKKIPALTLDPRWHELFVVETKSSQIRYLEDQVNFWLKKQGQVNNDLKEIRELKSRLMEGIVANMESDSRQDDSKRNKRMDQSQKLIKEANQKIIDLEDEKMDIPYKLLEANKELMLATVKQCYDVLISSEEEAEVIGKWISEIRTELKMKLIIKQEIEEKNALIYSNLHDILGSEVMGIIDRKNENS